LVVPTRHLLGAVLIKAVGTQSGGRLPGRSAPSPEQRLGIVRAVQSLEMRGRSADASAARQQFDTAWKNADVTLVASAY
jgi:hypothetical protein